MEQFGTEKPKEEVKPAGMPYEPLTAEELARLQQVPSPVIRERVAEQLAYPSARADVSREEAQAVEKLAAAAEAGGAARAEAQKAAAEVAEKLEESIGSLEEHLKDVPEEELSAAISRAAKNLENFSRPTAEAKREAEQPINSLDVAFLGERDGEEGPKEISIPGEKETVSPARPESLPETVEEPVVEEMEKETKKPEVAETEGEKPTAAQETTLKPAKEQVPEKVAEKELEQPEEKREKSAAELDLENPAARFDFGVQAKKLFNQLTDRARGRAAALYHFYAGDRLELAYSKFWSRRHEQKEAKAQDRLDEVKGGMVELEKSEADLSGRVEELKNKGVTVGLEAQVKSLRDIQKEKNKLQKDEDVAAAKLEKQRLQKERFSGRRERACRKFIDVYDEKIRPLEDGLDKAQSAKEKIATELADLRQRQTDMKNRLAGLKTELDREKYPAFKKAIKKAIGEIEANIYVGDKVAREAESRLDKYEKRIANLTSKSNDKKIARNKYARMAGLEEVKIGLADAGMAAPEKTIPEEMPSAGAEQRTEKEIKMKLADYVDFWNTGFAFGVPLGTEEMLGLLPEEERDKELDLDEFEDLVMRQQESVFAARNKKFGRKAQAGIQTKVGWLEGLLNMKF